MSLDYIHEKRYIAVGDLAASTESLQDRLAAAYRQFHTIGNHLTDLPLDLRKDYEAIVARLTSGTPKHDDEGIVFATLRTMSDEETKSMIEKIVILFNGVTALQGPDPGL